MILLREGFKRLYKRREIKDKTKKRLIIKACDSRIHVTILGFLLNKFLSGICWIIF